MVTSHATLLFKSIMRMVSNEAYTSTLNLKHHILKISTDMFLGNVLLTTIVPFKGYKGVLSITTADMDGDQILDIVVGRYDAGYEPRVIVYTGSNYKFDTIIANFLAFDASCSGGVRVAAGMVGATGLVNNIIVGTGTGIVPPVVKVFRILNYISDTVVVDSAYLKLHPVLTAPPLFAQFIPDTDPCRPIPVFSPVTIVDCESITSITTGVLDLFVSDIFVSVSYD